MNTETEKLCTQIISAPSSKEIKLNCFSGIDCTGNRAKVLAMYDKNMYHSQLREECRLHHREATQTSPHSSFSKEIPEDITTQVMFQTFQHYQKVQEEQVALNIGGQCFQRLHYVRTLALSLPWWCWKIIHYGHIKMETLLSLTGIQLTSS